ncbi:hypothetical protein GQ457_07G014830 [Hibiscus cannabinus]
MSPTLGTLREPVWIMFDQDMVISRREQLIVNSYKTMDGRGHDIQIVNGPCITLHNGCNGEEPVTLIVDNRWMQTRYLAQWMCGTAH